jgi:hypothetical protein
MSTPFMCDANYTIREVNNDLSTLENAIALAVEKHRGQVDKAGAPYILHPLRVMLAVSSEHERMAAVLHDVVEDCGVTLDDLRERGFPEAVVEAVEALTKRPDEHGPDRYFSFVERAGQDEIARVVKLADIEDNMDLSRIDAPTEDDLVRVERYRKARKLLEAIGRERAGTSAWTRSRPDREAGATPRVTGASRLPGGAHAERWRREAGQAAPSILSLKSKVTIEEVEAECPDSRPAGDAGAERQGARPIIACDFYIEGAERDVPHGEGKAPQGEPRVPRLGRITNIDHHAPLPEMERPVTSTQLAAEYLVAGFDPAAAPAPWVVINHTDCDSVLSSAIVMGLIEPHECFVAASIAADHTGEEDEIADLLQALDEGREGNRTDEQYVESLRNLILLREGKPLELCAKRALELRRARRAAAKQLVADGRLEREGGLAWAIVDEQIDGALFPVLLPDAVLIMLAFPHPNFPDRWAMKLRLGLGAPPGLTLHSLRITEWDPGFGGRWNAGSNKRPLRNGVGGTTMEPRDYANRLKARLMEQARS